MCAKVVAWSGIDKHKGTCKNHKSVAVRVEKKDLVVVRGSGSKPSAGKQAQSKDILVKVRWSMSLMVFSKLQICITVALASLRV